MNLYLVHRRFAVRANQKSAMVVRAKTEDDARALAQENAGKEGREAWERSKADVTPLRPSGEREVILEDVKCAGVAAVDLTSVTPITRRGVLDTLLGLLTGSRQC